MNNFLETAFATISGATLVLGLALLFLRQYIRNLIDLHFSTLKSKIDESMRLQSKSAEEQLHQQLSVYPALAALIYSAKIAAEKARRAEFVHELLSLELLDSCRELSSNLVRYRIYLPASLFEAVHTYKHLIQDLLVIADVSTRPSTTAGIVRISDEKRTDIDRLCQSISGTCDTIIAELQSAMHAPQVRPDNRGCSGMEPR